MTCTHLKELYSLCEKHNLKLTSTDLVRIVCTQCGEQEVCPSILMEEYEAHHPDDATVAGGEPPKIVNLKSKCLLTPGSSNCSPTATA